MTTKLLSTGQAAKLLNVTPDTVLKWIAKGQLPAIQTPGGHNRINCSDVDAIANRSEGGRKPMGDDLQYCWEFFSPQTGISEVCRKCLVHRAHAFNCYEICAMSHQFGFGAAHCRTPCEECDYFRLVHQQPSPPKQHHRTNQN